ncbi:MAG: carbohydrate binding domain-containing protein, partial [Nocardioidaceae bacterium]|nr:carbohydrate binding domain-containing protein [Nocardioidaceae bacterium]
MTASPPREPSRSARGLTHQRRVALTVGATLLAAPILPTLTAAPAASETKSAGANLVVNGSFEEGTSGWRTNRNRQLLSATRPAVAGAKSARLEMTKPGRTVLRTVRPTVATADATATYTASAYVKAKKGPLNGVLRVREGQVNNKYLAQHTQGFRATSTWKKVSLTFTPETTAPLDVAVVGFNIPKGSALLVDKVTLVSNKPTPTPTPT